MSFSGFKRSASSRSLFSSSTSPLSVFAEASEHTSPSCLPAHTASAAQNDTAFKIPSIRIGSGAHTQSTHFEKVCSFPSTFKNATFCSPLPSPTDNDLNLPTHSTASTIHDQDTIFSEVITPSSAKRCCTAPPPSRASSTPLCVEPTKFALPIINSRRAKHVDLATITAETLFRLLCGEYNDVIGSFEIIDCRYPFEYAGGHIHNAKNIYDPFQMQEHFFTRPLHPVNPCKLHDDADDSSKLLRAVSLSTVAEEDLELIHDAVDFPASQLSVADSPQPKRHIILFHCEFSHSRGPAMMRAMRNYDRQLHRSVYPKVAYPELYLIEHGYSNYFASYAASCSPRAYVRMLDERFTRECALHRKDVQAKFSRFPDTNKCKAVHADTPRLLHNHDNIDDDEDEDGDDMAYLPSKPRVCASLFELSVDTLASPTCAMTSFFATMEVGSTPGAIVSQSPHV